MADRTFAQNFVFFNILPFSPGEEELLAREAAEYTERTGNRNVLYSLTLSPAGFPAMNKVLFMLESYRKLKAALELFPVFGGDDAGAPLRTLFAF